MRTRLAVTVLGGLAVACSLAAPALDALSAGPGGEETSEGRVGRSVEAAPLALVAMTTKGAERDAFERTAAPAEPTEAKAAAPAEPAKAVPEPAPADLVVIDPSDVNDETEWVGPPVVIPDCDARMDAAGIDYASSRLPVHKTRGGIYCGAEQVVRYRKGPGAISWGGSPKVTCPVALGMAKLESIVQEEAERHLGRKVRRIQHMGTYNCREMANYPGWVSEHSYANAIDIKHFELTNGKKIPVLGTYPKNGAEPKNASGRFLKAVARRLYDERVFSVVLTPSFDSNHRNHFHLDMARYLVDGT
jgi:hypothetical protein